MKIINAALALSFVALVGCHDASKDIEKFADRACACKDAGCAEKVISEFADWAKKNKDARGDQDRATKAAERIGKCVIEAGMAIDKLQDAMKGLE